MAPTTLLLLLLAAIGRALGEPIFLPKSPMMIGENLFKGLPKLPSFNETAGETRSVYYHEQIIAIIDVFEGKKLLHCELIEVYEPSEAEEVLKNLSMSFEPHEVAFKDIIKLMDKCDKLDAGPARALALSTINAHTSMAGNPLILGIIPGTKWCGTGDVAKSYHDLGPRSRIDRCCRAHDLCPIKIRAYRNRYSLVNNSFFSKSHCTCDDIFYGCLKRINHVTANIVGNIYFNIAQPPCIEDEQSSSDKNSKKFVPMKKRF